MFVYSCTHIYSDTINDPARLAATVAQDLARYNTRFEDHDSIILSFLAEGHDNNTIAPFIDYLTTMVPIEKIGVLFNATVTENLPYRYQCFEDYLCNYCNFFWQIEEFDHEWPTLQLDKKFLCLNRRSSEIRAQLVYTLQDRLHPDSMRASLDSISATNSRNAIFIDGSVDINQQHTNVGLPFRSCLFNIISESSDQSSPGVWKKVFITEKTYKAFAFRHVPLWMAVPGLVARVRNFGFDLFDDLCDNHSYDDIQDETERLHRVVDIAAKLDQQFSLSDCQQLKQDLASRLNHNYSLLRNLVHNLDQTRQQHFNNLVNPNVHRI